ncbi:MAG TPA: hypothetical protein VGM76_03965 [Lacipirellulaceae bacterium]|jgi:hypothetical protein
MAFELKWTKEADEKYTELKRAAEDAQKNRTKRRKSKSSKQEGLFKQVAKTISFLKQNPRHPSLCCHSYSGLQHPYDAAEKVWEAYVQNNTASAYRVFWSYGPGRKELTIIAITPHP